jgi:hypothetical protein
MEFINLCPHTINVMDEAGEIHTFPPSGTVARVVMASKKAGSLAGFRLATLPEASGPIVGLPEAQPNTVYIVSGLVLAAVDKYRGDVVAPDTGPTQVRFTAADEAAGLGKEGQTRYVKGFVI